MIPDPSSGQDPLERVAEALRQVLDAKLYIRVPGSAERAALANELALAALAVSRPAEGEQDVTPTNPALARAYGVEGRGVAPSVEGQLTPEDARQLLGAVPWEDPEAMEYTDEQANALHAKLRALAHREGGTDAD